MEIGNEVFYDIFKGDPPPVAGRLSQNDTWPGLGIELDGSNLDKLRTAA